MNKKNKIEYGITAVFLVILLFALNNTIKNVNKIKASKEKNKKNILKETVVSREEMPLKDVIVEVDVQKDKGLFLRLKDEVENLEPGIDPFFSTPLGPEKSQQGMHLEGIIWDNENPIALIDNRAVRKGDIISDNVAKYTLIISFFYSKIQMENNYFTNIYM